MPYLKGLWLCQTRRVKVVPDMKWLELCYV